MDVLTYSWDLRTFRPIQSGETVPLKECLQCVIDKLQNFMRIYLCHNSVPVPVRSSKDWSEFWKG